MKVLILLCYYNRPKMVKNALKSILNQSYTNWELVFVDDSEELNQDLVDYLNLNFKDKVTYYHTNDTKEAKISRGYSTFGSYWNKGCQNSTSDIVLMLCDDDALYEDYLLNLNTWYENNPDKHYCYSHVVNFNPQETQPEENNYDPNYWLNRTEPINPCCMVDASQVSWRLKSMLESGITFPETQTANLDAAVYGQMQTTWGLCEYSGFVGQYKATFPDQLGNRPNTYDTVDLV